jgi:hypothetical protein
MRAKRTGLERKRPRLHSLTNETDRVPLKREFPACLEFANIRLERKHPRLLKLSDRNGRAQVGSVRTHFAGHSLSCSNPQYSKKITEMKR